MVSVGLDRLPLCPCVGCCVMVFVLGTMGGDFDTVLSHSRRGPWMLGRGSRKVWVSKDWPELSTSQVSDPKGKFYFVGTGRWVAVLRRMISTAHRCDSKAGTIEF
jgi:hypothetical protein